MTKEEIVNKYPAYKKLGEYHQKCILDAMDEYASPLLSRIEKLQGTLKEIAFIYDDHDSGKIAKQALSQEGEKE